MLRNASGSALPNGPLSADEIEILMRLLAKTKASARKAIANGGAR